MAVRKSGFLYKGAARGWFAHKRAKDALNEYPQSDQKNNRQLSNDRIPFYLLRKLEILPFFQFQNIEQMIKLLKQRGLSTALYRART